MYTTQVILIIHIAPYLLLGKMLTPLKFYEQNYYFQTCIALRRFPLSNRDSKLSGLAKS